MFQWFYRRFWALFCSLRLTAVILLLLLAGSFVGMFWDQTKSLAEHLQGVKHRWAAHLFTFLELNDVFHSWWFGSVVLLLALNLIACSIERLPKIWIDIHNPVKLLSDTFLVRTLAQFRFFSEDLPQVKHLIETQWGPRGEWTQKDNIWYYYGERHRYARCGVYVVHTALLLIMFGSIAATNLGVDGTMSIGEGQRLSQVNVRGQGGIYHRQELGFDVACLDFQLKTFTDDSPMEYSSRLAIFEPGQSQPVREQDIRVNEPLEYKGYTFYQSSYQALPGEQAVFLLAGVHGGPRQKYKLVIGERLMLENGFEVTPVEAYDDFGGLGAALKIQQKSPNGELTKFTLFRQYPDFDPLVRRGEVDVIYQGQDQPYATGLSVGKAPGLWAVWLGCALMLVGLFMAFVMNHRRYYARLTMIDDKLEIILAGTARRHMDSFRDEMEKRFKQIQQSLEETHD